MMYSATWYFIGSAGRIGDSLSNDYREIIQAPSSPASGPPLWCASEQTATRERPHAHATANPARPRFVDRTRTVRSPGITGGTVPSAPAAAREGLEDPGAGGVRLLFLCIVLPAAAVGRRAGPVP